MRESRYFIGLRILYILLLFAIMAAISNRLDSTVFYAKKLYGLRSVRSADRSLQQSVFGWEI